MGYRRIVFLGPPGSGKGTQTEAISTSLHLPKISTGDILRAAVKAQTPLGVAAKKVMDAGGLVSDDIIMGIVKARLAQSDCQAGYLLDGFPRTLGQAKGMEELNILVDAVIELQVADESIVERMSGRRVHAASGRSYHIRYNPPKKAGFDDVTGEALSQRDDDKEDTVRKRLQVYHQQTAPLIAHYSKQPKVAYFAVAGDAKVEQITTQILQHLQ